VTAPLTDAARLGRAAASLRERGAEQRARQETDGVDDRQPAGGAFWRARRAHLRRLAAQVGEGTLECCGGDVERATGSPAVHRIGHRPSVRWPQLPAPASATATVMSCLELVAGVGPVTAGRLRAAGHRRVEDLTSIPSFRIDATAMVREWERGDLRSTCARMTQRLGGRGHLLSALACSFVDAEEIAFLDLETMGLWNNTVFLAGVGRIVAGHLQVRQYLAPGHADEPAVVSSALADLAGARIVVTFNGRSADLPWLARRAFYYGLGPVPALVHVDLLYGTRRRYQYDEGRLDRVRLPDVSDEILDLPRPETDVPSWMVPEIYGHYAKAPDEREGLLLPLLEHNRVDLETLVHLLELLCREATACGATAAAR
jgi:uncharacterized protein YprB with RNaseH-like and TPR domain